MVSPEDLDRVARRLSEAVPEGLKGARDDLEANFRAVLQSAFQRMDLVTREEFEAQQAVLQRTREKLEAMSANLKELEDALKEDKR